MDRSGEKSPPTVEVPKGDVRPGYQQPEHMPSISFRGHNRLGVLVQTGSAWWESKRQVGSLSLMGAGSPCVIIRFVSSRRGRLLFRRRPIRVWTKRRVGRLNINNNKGIRPSPSIWARSSTHAHHEEMLFSRNRII